MDGVIGIICDGRDMAIRQQVVPKLLIPLRIVFGPRLTRMVQLCAIWLLRAGCGQAVLLSRGMANSLCEARDSWLIGLPLG